MQKVEYIVIKSRAFGLGAGEVVAAVKASSRDEAVKAARMAGVSAYPALGLKAILWSEATKEQREDAKWASIETTCWCGRDIRQWEDSLQFGGHCAHHRGA